MDFDGRFSCRRIRFSWLKLRQLHTWSPAWELPFQTPTLSQQLQEQRWRSFSNGCNQTLECIASNFSKKSFFYCRQKTVLWLSNLLTPYCVPLSLEVVGDFGIFVCRNMEAWKECMQYVHNWDMTSKWSWNFDPLALLLFYSRASVNVS